jgi:LacI family transcriptional regulator
MRGVTIKAVKPKNLTVGKKRAVRVRMIDIARQAGVSQATVSYVLNDRGENNGIGEKTAKKIRRIAQRLKFHPNHAARQLAGKRSGIIGILAETFMATELRIFACLNRLAAARGFKILAWQSDAHPEELDKFVDECSSWNIDGLIYVPHKYEGVSSQVANALGRLPRVVSILANAGIEDGHAIEVDAAHGVRRAVEHLFRQGRRRIVQILEGLDVVMDQQRYQAFLAAHQEFYGPADSRTIEEGGQLCFATKGWRVENYADYLELARKLVVDGRADAILTESDFSAPGLIRGLTQLGFRVPGDVALIGWGGETVARGISPGLTTVDFDIEQVVERSLDLLTGLIERPEEAQPASILVKPKLVVKETA